MLKIRQVSKEDVGILYDLIIGIAKHHHQEQFILTNKEELFLNGSNKIF